MNIKHCLIVFITILFIIFLSQFNFNSLNFLRVHHFGLICRDHICVENVKDHAALHELFEKSLHQLQARELDLEYSDIGIFVFCESQNCYTQFGGGNDIAISYPWLGTVISHKAWNQTIVTHELIHLIQYKHFGPLHTMLLPEWFREGMAYALSGAPKEDIPSKYHAGVYLYQKMVRSD
tara:strand:- start:2256 stop:2792 length:537 start_codon:yes stop_codon:yes gene_type:complete